MLPLPSEYSLEKLPSPPRYPPEEFVKDLVDRVIDAITLHQVRLYTLVGAEVQYGDLVFTPYQDPFAYVPLKHEEVNDDVFTEIDEYPASQTTPTIAITDENQTFPTSSSTPAAISSSANQGNTSKFADDQGVDSGDLPAFIRDSLLVPFTVLTFSFFVSAKVWEAVQDAPNPTKVEVTAMRDLVPVIPAKRSSTLESPASSSKCAKVEALNKTDGSIHLPTSSIKVIPLDEELTSSNAEATATKNAKCIAPSSSIHSRLRPSSHIS
ncbi:hypothetical protein LIER_28289 [Lithospermum erythrorhizon]|uniref:Uncharacterized protein n=1 Tax=Lithospermum erythrorhizon TaxID=34254 RepID=A0AAV3RH33_LITER